MLIFWAVLGGFLLDALFGDPAWLPHPVVLMGRCISALEKHLRTALPKTPRGELAGGATVAAVLPLGTLAVTGLACWAAARLHPALGLALQMLWCGQALAAKGLAQESRNVYKELAKGDLPAARRAVARIVGRDTQNLTAAGVTRAAVETVAENASDGVIAPLLYMLLGGAPLALTYKAINTMDSMLGYKNEKYLYFGRCAAKLDDAANAGTQHRRGALRRLRLYGPASESGKGAVSEAPVFGGILSAADERYLLPLPARKAGSGGMIRRAQKARAEGSDQTEKSDRRNRYAISEETLCRNAPRRRTGQPPDGIDGEHGQACRPVRRQVPHH